MATKIIGRPTTGTSTNYEVLVSANGELKVVENNATNILAELQSIDNNLDTVETKLQSIIDNTDTVETKLQSIIDNTDTVETKLQSIIDNTTAKTPVVKRNEWSTTTTAESIWTPTTGKKFVVTDILVSFSSTGSITIFDNTDSLANRIYKGWFVANGGSNVDLNTPVPSSTANNVLKYSSTGAGSLTIVGYEE